MDNDLFQSSKNPVCSFIPEYFRINIFQTIKIIQSLFDYNTLDRVKQTSNKACSLFRDYEKIRTLMCKDWPAKKVTIYFPIFYLVKSLENI